MEGGLLKYEIMFQRQFISLDEYGHEVITYRDAFPTRANVKWNSGDRIISNEEIFYDNSLTFTVRSYCPVEETMIILFKDKKYRIITINPELDMYNRKEIIAQLINE